MSSIFDQYIVPLMIVGVILWYLIPLSIKWKRGDDIAPSMKGLVVFGLTGVGVVLICMLLAVTGIL